MSDKKTKLYNFDTNPFDNFVANESNKNDQLDKTNQLDKTKYFHFPPVEKSFRSLNGKYLITISSNDFFVEDVMSRNIALEKNARLWLLRISNLESSMSYCTECYEFFWKPFVGLFLYGIDIAEINNGRNIIIKFVGGDVIELDKINNTTFVEVKDFDSCIFIE